MPTKVEWAGFGQYCEQRTWPSVAYIAAWGAGLIIFFYTQSYLVLWHLPKPQEIIKSSGSFIGERSPLHPYAFVTDEGERMLLGCVPQIEGSYCLEHVGVSMKALPASRVTVGHYRVIYPPWRILRRGSPDILVSVDRDGQSLYSFRQSHAELVSGHAIQVRSQFIPAIAMFVGACLLMLATWISGVKLVRMWKGTAGTDGKED
jgi:hypothetical protein